jgi:hypothetical protein
MKDSALEPGDLFIGTQVKEFLGLYIGGSSSGPNTVVLADLEQAPGLPPPPRFASYTLAPFNASIVRKIGGPFEIEPATKAVFKALAGAGKPRDVAFAFDPEGGLAISFRHRDYRNTFSLSTGAQLHPDTAVILPPQKLFWVDGADRLELCQF